MTAPHKADRYISPGGRRPFYGRKEFVDDLMCASAFLIWAAEKGAHFGGYPAADAYQAMMRLLDMDPIKLRKITLGGGE